MEPADRFDELYHENYAAVARYARRRADPDTTSDVVAETFLIAWRRLDFVPVGPADAQPWLYGVARRVLATIERSGGWRTASRSGSASTARTSTCRTRPGRLSSEPGWSRR